MTAAQGMTDRTASEPTETEQIASELLLTAIAIERFSADMTRRIMRRFREMERDLIAAILDSDFQAPRDDVERKAQQAELMLLAADIVGAAYDDIIYEVTNDLETVAEVSSDSTSTALALVLGLAFLGLSRTRLREIAEDTLFEGGTVEDWFRQHEADALFRFRRAIQDGAENDQSTGEIIDTIVGTDEVQRQDGIFQPSKRNAEVLIVTIAAAVATAARLATITEARVSDEGGGIGDEGGDESVVKVVGQLSILDSRTSAVCMAYSGKRWSLPDYRPIGHNLPFAGGTPRHWRCRSQIIPIIDPKVRPTGTQASESGEVPAHWTFEDWLRSRPQDEQRDVLGAGKYDLWKAGKLSVSDLVDQRGNPLTVAALVKRFAKRAPRRT